MPKTSKNKEAVQLSLNELRKQAREKYLKEQQTLEEIEEQLQNIDVQPLYIYNEDDEPEFVPNEVMLLIFAFVGHEQLSQTVSRVCRGWNFIATKSNKIWRELYESYFIRNKNSIVLDDNEQDNTGTFDGHWRKNFIYRFALRQKWRNNKPHSIECLDVCNYEIIKPHDIRRRDHMFTKDQYLVGQMDEDNTSKSNLYSVDVQSRTGVTSMTLDNDKLISGDQAGRIKIFSLHSKQIIKQMNGHTTQITHLAVDQQHQVLYSASANNEIFVWNMETSLLSGVITIRSTSQTMEVYIVDMQIDLTNRLLYIATPIAIEVHDLDTREFKFILQHEKKKRARRQDVEMQENRRIEDHEDEIMENFENAQILVNTPAVAADVEDQDDEDEDDGMNGHGVNGKSIYKMCINTSAEYPRVAACHYNGQVKIYQIFNQFGIMIKTIELKNIVSSSNHHTLGGGAANTVDQNVRATVLNVKFEENRPNQLILALRHDPVHGNDYRTIGSFLQVVDISTGMEIKRKRIKLASPSPSGTNYYYDGEAGFVYWDDDKIVRTAGNEVIVCDRDNGIKASSISIPNFTVHSYITFMFCDEKCLILGVSFGGIIYLDFGGNLTYWKHMKHGKVLA